MLKFSPLKKDPLAHKNGLLIPALILRLVAHGVLQMFQPNSQGEMIYPSKKYC